MKEINLIVSGMMCGGCENRVKNAVGDIDEVEEVRAEHESGIVNVKCNDDVSEDLIRETIEDIGYEIVKE